MPIITGTSGNDTLNGDFNDDYIEGLEGDDTINGGGGNDTVLGGDGNDTITTTDGWDQIDGGAGDDVINAGDGPFDQISDGAGNDIVYGGRGFDYITGSAGNDIYDGAAPGQADDEYDAVDYWNTALAGIVVNLGAVTDQVRSVGDADAAGIGVDQLTNIEGVLGSAFNDSMTGDSGGNMLDGSSGDDVIDGGGGGDELYGGDGNDTVSGGDGEDEIFAGDGNDNVQGGNGDDYLFGSYGSDTVLGGAGSDELEASADGVADTYDGGTGNSAEIDTVTYWEALAGITVDLSAASDQARSTGEGDAAGIGIDQLVNIEGVTGGQFDDHITGNSADNWLDGSSGSDVIIDGAGSDFVWGGDGWDTIYASIGAGNDIYDGGEDFISPVDHDMINYFYAASGVLIDLQSGSAQSLLAGDAAGIGTDQIFQFEDAAGSAFDDQILGTFEGNSLFGGAGDDTVFGGGGADLLSGGSGNDTLDGGEGTDRASYGSSSVGVTVSLAITEAQDTGQGLDTLISIEQLTGSAHSDRLYGDEGVNSLSGLDGADYLYGNGGNDSLLGFTGDDRLFGGEGNDTLNGGAGYDRLYGGGGNDIYTVTDATDFAYENADEGTDLVNSTINHQLRAHVENLTLTGTAQIGEGNELANALTGNSSANRLYGLEGNDTLLGMAGDDYLMGGAGNDQLNGGTGYDRMYGGAGDDTYIVTDTTDYSYENAGEGYDTVITGINHALRANVEELVLGDTSDLRGYGNAIDNLLRGNSGNNLLYGRDGNDTLKGNAGNDILYGENGDDGLDGGSGQDRFYGGSGADDFIFANGDFAGMASGTADRIHDFAQGSDQLDLGLVDANSALANDQAFTFIGNGAFTGAAGELRYQQISGNTYVMGDVDGDGNADFWVRLDGLHSLQSSDFIV